MPLLELASSKRKNAVNGKRTSECFTAEDCDWCLFCSNTRHGTCVTERRHHENSLNCDLGLEDKQRLWSLTTETPHNSALWLERKMEGGGLSFQNWSAFGHVKQKEHDQEGRSAAHCAQEGHDVKVNPTQRSSLLPLPPGQTGFKQLGCKQSCWNHWIWCDVHMSTLLCCQTWQRCKVPVMPMHHKTGLTNMWASPSIS